MHNTVKTLGKATIIYSLSGIIVRGCSYLVLLLQTNILTPSMYSIVTEFYGIYMTLGHVLYDLAMDMAYFKFLYKLGPQHTFNVIVTILLFTSIIFSVTLIISMPQIAKLTNHLSHMHYFYYMVGILTLDALLMIPFARLRAEKKTLRFLSIKFLAALAHIIFSFMLLYFPIWLKLIEDLIYSCFNVKVVLNGLDAVFIANLLSNLTTLSLLLPSFKGFHLTWSSHAIQTMAQYTTTSFFTMLFIRINEALPLSLFRRLVSNQFYINHTKEEILGNFGASCKLILLITLGIQGFKYAAEPFFFANSDRKDAPKLYSQTMHLFILISCLCLLLFSLNIDWIAKMLIPNAGYRNTMDTLPYLAFAHIVFGVYYNFSLAFKLSQHPQYNTYIHALGSLAIGGASFLWIPRLGHWGCVYASISGAVIMALLGYYMGQKCYAIPYHKQGFLLLLFTFLAVGKVALWPTKLVFLGMGWAYILLNTIILAIFYIIGIAWQKIH